MTAPSISAQLATVEWIELHLREMGRRAKLRDSEINEMIRRLQAVIETLQMLERESRR